MKLSYLCNNATPSFKQFLLSGFCCRNIDFLWINLRYQPLKLYVLRTLLLPLFCLLHHSPRRLVQFWQNLQTSLVLLIPNCTRQRMITYTNKLFFDESCVLDCVFDSILESSWLTTNLNTRLLYYITFFSATDIQSRE